MSFSKPLLEKIQQQQQQQKLRTPMIGYGSRVLLDVNFLKNEVY